MRFYCKGAKARRIPVGVFLGQSKKPVLVSLIEKRNEDGNA